MEELNAFEAAILAIQKNGYTKEADAKPAKGAAKKGKS